jgi:hypothetical protein
MMRAGEEARYAGPRPTAGEELAVDRPTPQLEGSASWDDEGCVEGGGGCVTHQQRNVRLGCGPSCRKHMRLPKYTYMFPCTGSTSSLEHHNHSQHRGLTRQHRDSSWAASPTARAGEGAYVRACDLTLYSFD